MLKFCTSGRSIQMQIGRSEFVQGHKMRGNRGTVASEFLLLGASVDPNTDEGNKVGKGTMIKASRVQWCKQCSRIEPICPSKQ